MTRRLFLPLVFLVIGLGSVYWTDPPVFERRILGMLEEAKLETEIRAVLKRPNDVLSQVPFHWAG